jgi:hypothetical protein
MLKKVRDPIVSSVVSWSAVNFNDLGVRVIGVAVVVMLGNGGSIVASYLYPLSDGPHYCMYCYLGYISLFVYLILFY